MKGYYKVPRRDVYVSTIRQWIACIILSHVVYRLMPPVLPKIGALLLALALLSGCGTVCTRGAVGYNTFGARPYEAVAQDAVVIEDVIAGEVDDGADTDTLQAVAASFCLISMPVDLVLDWALFVPDLIAGEFYGCRKQPAWHFDRQW